jgi:N-acetylglucosamine-6-sulfatase
VCYAQWQGGEVLVVPTPILRAFVSSLVPALVLGVPLAGSIAGQQKAIAGTSTIHALVPDCDDIDSDCDPAEPQLGTVIKRAAGGLLECARQNAGACDVAGSLAGVKDEQCRDAIECQLYGLLAIAGDASRPCARRRFRAGVQLIRTKVRRLKRGASYASGRDLRRCARRARRSCRGATAPPPGGSCGGKSTLAAAAACVCGEADALAAQFLKRYPSSCVSHTTGSCPTTTVAGAPRPNVVIILSDDQRWDTVDATHQSPRQPGYVMPNVKRELTDSGITFTQANVTTALCCPSRASILTGEYAHRTGVLENVPPNGGASAFDDHCTLATWLKAAGYTTGFIGKYLNGYGHLAPCIPPAYDDWFVQLQVKYYDYDVNHNGTIKHFGTAASDYSGDVMTARAVAFIHAAATSGQPFFLHVSQKAPHVPATPAPRDVGLFAGLAPFRPPNYAEADVSDKPVWVQALAWTHRDETVTDALRIHQLETLQDVDRGVAAIMQALREVGHDRDTLVIYASDNGYSWGSHRWLQKRCPYEECIRVPLVVRYPDLAGTTPRTDDRIVLNVDLAPTIAELAGVQPPEPVNGMSLVPLLTNDTQSWRNDMLNEHWEGAGIPTNALVKGWFDGGLWKYIEYATGETELYDLTADPFELTNVSSDPSHAALVGLMAARLHELQAE